ncbi:unnamed protein product [Cochlearia groenlandica]
MVASKSLIFAVLALSLLLLGGEAREFIGVPESELMAVCCNNQAEFGKCDTKEDEERCAQMCISSNICASMTKGGGCQPTDVSPGSTCSCYC